MYNILYGDYDHLEDFCTISGNGLISVRDSLLFLVKFIEITTTLGLGQTRICCFKQFLQGSQPLGYQMDILKKSMVYDCCEILKYVT